MKSCEFRNSDWNSAATNDLSSDEPKMQGMRKDGQKELLGMYVSESEGHN